MNGTLIRNGATPFFKTTFELTTATLLNLLSDTTLQACQESSISFKKWESHGIGSLTRSDEAYKHGNRNLDSRREQEEACLCLVIRSLLIGSAEAIM